MCDLCDDAENLIGALMRARTACAGRRFAASGSSGGRIDAKVVVLDGVNGGFSFGVEAGACDGRGQTRSSTGSASHGLEDRAAVGFVAREAGVETPVGNDIVGRQVGDADAEAYGPRMLDVEAPDLCACLRETEAFEAAHLRLVAEGSLQAA